MKSLHSINPEIPVSVLFYAESPDPAKYEENNVKFRQIIKAHPPEITLRFAEEEDNPGWGSFNLHYLKNDKFHLEDNPPEQPERYLPRTGVRYENWDFVRLGQIISVYDPEMPENYALVSFDEEKAEYFLFYGKDIKSEPLSNRISRKYGQFVIDPEVHRIGTIFSKEGYIVNHNRYKEFLAEFDRVIWLFKEG